MNHMTSYQRLQYDMTEAAKRAANHRNYQHRINVMTAKVFLYAFVLPMAAVVGYCLLVG